MDQARHSAQIEDLGGVWTERKPGVVHRKGTSILMCVYVIRQGEAKPGKSEAKAVCELHGKDQIRSRSRCPWF